MRCTVGTPKVIDARSQDINRDGVHSGVAYANFKAHRFSYLNISSLATTYVLKGSECGTACVNIPSCFSFNLAAFFDLTNLKILCELLPSDKYNNSQKFVSSQSFHHYSFGVRNKKPANLIKELGLHFSAACLLHSKGSVRGRVEYLKKNRRKTYTHTK